MILTDVQKLIVFLLVINPILISFIGGVIIWIEWKKLKSQEREETANTLIREFLYENQKRTIEKTNEVDKKITKVAEAAEITKEAIRPLIDGSSGNSGTNLLKSSG